MDSKQIEFLIAPFKTRHVEISVGSSRDFNNASARFVCILHLASRQHWVCVTRVRGVSYFVDSFPSPERDEEFSRIKQLLGAPLRVIECKVQARASSCGLFAAFAAILFANGRDICDAFDQFKTNSTDNEVALIEFFRKGRTRR